jgi:hypothetical protein
VTWDPGAASGARRAALARGARRQRGDMGMCEERPPRPAPPRPGPQVAPGVAADELSLGRRLEAWRAGIDARILTRELPVPDSLGRPPADPVARAHAVSVVALARAARPEGATSDVSGRAESLRAPWARTRARRASGHHPRAGSECHPALPEPLRGAEERATARAVGGWGGGGGGRRAEHHAGSPRGLLLGWASEVPLDAHWTEAQLPLR